MIRPEDVSPQQAQMVLDFLNSAQRAEDIAARIEIAGELDIGIRLAQRLLQQREQLGGAFRDLNDIHATPLIGPERFSEIVSVLTGLPLTEQHITDASLSASVFTELAQLREMVIQLQQYVRQQAIAPRNTICIEQIQESVFIGQPITFLLCVRDGTTQKPVPNARVTLTSNWGKLIYRMGFGAKSANVLQINTDINGRARLQLQSLTHELLSQQQQVALQAALRLLDNDADTPLATAAGFTQLVEQYRQAPNTELRSAIDIYFQARKEELVNAVNAIAPINHWVYHHALVSAYIYYPDGEKSGGEVQAMATATTRVKDWVGPWYQTYHELLQGNRQLNSTITKVSNDRGDKSKLANRILAAIDSHVQAEPGLTGSLIGQKTAQQAVQQFLSSEAAALPLSVQEALFPSLNIARHSLSGTSIGTLGALNLARTEVLTTVDQRIGGIDSVADLARSVSEDIAAVQSEMATFRTDFNNFNRDYGTFNESVTSFNNSYSLFNTNYSNFTEGFNTFTDNYNTFSTDYASFSSSYMEFSDRYQTFNSDYLAFNDDYDVFNNNIVAFNNDFESFNNNYATFNGNYNSFRNDYVTFDANYQAFTRDYGIASQRIETFNSDYLAFSDDYDVFNNNIVAFNNDFESFNNNYATFNGNYDSFRNDYVTFDANYQAFTRDYGMASQRIETFNNSHESFVADYDAFNDNYQSFSDSYQNFDNNLQAFNSNYQRFSNNYQSFSNNYQSFNSRYIEFNSRYSDFNSSYTDFNNDYANFSNNYTNFSNSYAVFNNRYAAFNNDFSQFNNNFSTFENNYSVFATNYSNFSGDYSVFTESIAEVNNNIDSVNVNMNQFNTDYQKFQRDIGGDLRFNRPPNDRSR